MGFWPPSITEPHHFSPHAILRRLRWSATVAVSFTPLYHGHDSDSVIESMRKLFTAGLQVCLHWQVREAALVLVVFAFRRLPPTCLVLPLSPLLHSLHTTLHTVCGHIALATTTNITHHHHHKRKSQEDYFTYYFLNIFLN